MDKNKNKKTASVGENIRTIVYAVLIALVIRSFMFEPFNIPSGSMFPTLLEGDFLFVSKYTYGYSRYSLPLGMPLIPGRIWFDEPERGDVIVFKLPSATNIDYIKRLVGLPGDTVKMTDGRLYINGEMVERRKIEDYLIRDKHGSTERYSQYIEILPGGKEHPIIEVNDHGLADNTVEFKVPEGHYFFMGDNRDNSTDSRFPQVGMVPRENLVGKARVLFFSYDDKNSLLAFWQWPQTIRWNRIFDKIK